MPYTIDTTSYDKARARPYDPRRPLAAGYSPRPASRLPSRIVLHSTEGNAGSTFESEAAFLRDSELVSAHYLVGKVAQIAQILDPVWRAWHTGNVLPQYADYINADSIGIEQHHREGESWPAAQRDALTWLVRRLMADYHIAYTQVETHGQVAAPGPYDRKHDPTNWPHADFLLWRSTLTPLTSAPNTWTLWGSAFPLPAAQRGWAIPQLWYANADVLGAALSAETYLDPNTSLQTFVGGIVVYEKQPDRASLLRRVQRLG